MWWVLRVGTVGRWKDKNAEKASKDLLLRQGEKGLSVYRVGSQEEADRVGVLFGMYGRGKPRELDYILIPQRCCVDRFRLVHSPVSDLPEELGALHYEIEGLDGEGAAVKLAEAILADDAMQVRHLREMDVLLKAAELVAEKPSHVDRLTQHWKDELAANSPGIPGARPPSPKR